MEDAFEDFGDVYNWTDASRDDWSERNIGLGVFGKAVNFREATRNQFHFAERLRSLTSGIPCQAEIGVPHPSPTLGVSSIVEIYKYCTCHRRRSQ